MKVEYLREKIILCVVFLSIGMGLTFSGSFKNDQNIVDWGAALLVLSLTPFAEEIAELIKKFITS